jgi:hypothetical protein
MLTPEQIQQYANTEMAIIHTKIVFDGGDPESRDCLELNASLRYLVTELIKLRDRTGYYE